LRIALVSIHLALALQEAVLSDAQLPIACFGGISTLTENLCPSTVDLTKLCEQTHIRPQQPNAGLL
jgi:hypothetical protein